MNNFRTVKEARINFLFFQDIITCVMGILILITLMLSLSLDAGGAATAEETPAQSELKHLKQTLADTEQQNQAIEQQALRLASIGDRSALETELALLQRQIEQSAEQVRQSEQTAAARNAQAQTALLEMQSATNLQRAVVALKDQLAAAREQLASVRRQTNSIYIVPSAEPQDARQPIAFILSSNKFRIHRFNNAAAQDGAISSIEDIRPVLASLNPTRDYLVFYFRPSGAKWFEPLRNLARSLGFAVGYDAVEEQKQIVFSNE